MSRRQYDRLEPSEQAERSSHHPWSKPRRCQPMRARRDGQAARSRSQKPSLLTTTAAIGCRAGSAEAGEPSGPAEEIGRPCPTGGRRIRAGPWDARLRRSGGCHRRGNDARITGPPHDRLSETRSWRHVERHTRGVPCETPGLAPGYLRVPWIPPQNAIELVAGERASRYRASSSAPSRCASRRCRLSRARFAGSSTDRSAPVSRPWR